MPLMTAKVLPLAGVPFEDVLEQVVADLLAPFLHAKAMPSCGPIWAQIDSSILRPTLSRVTG